MRAIKLNILGYVLPLILSGVLFYSCIALTATGPHWRRRAIFSYWSFSVIQSLSGISQEYTQASWYPCVGSFKRRSRK